MIKFEPLVWFDVDRVEPAAIRAAILARPNWAFVPCIPSSNGQPPIGIVAPVYPSPDELFRWEPK